MSSRRTLKAASAIREVVSMAILTELRDPRVQNVTVTFVELSADMRHAKIHVSVMGSQKEQDLCLHGLRRAAGFLQKRLGFTTDESGFQVHAPHKCFYIMLSVETDFLL